MDEDKPCHDPHCRMQGPHIYCMPRDPVQQIVDDVTTGFREDLRRIMTPTNAGEIEGLVARMTRTQMKMLWQAYGGRQHGPNVEQYYIEEGAWYRFAEAFESRVLEQVTALQSEVAALREALEPFAKMGRMLDGPFAPVLFKDGDSFVSGGAWSENGVKRTLTYGDLRAARAALARGGDHG